MNNPELVSEARCRVAGPAIALAVVACVSAAAVLYSVANTLSLLLTGAGIAVPQPSGLHTDTQLLVRFTWGVLLLAANIVVLIGALRMKELRSRPFSTVACVLAIIPCFGPCFVLGIPFGIWGLVALNDQRVRQAFNESPSRPG